MQDFLSHIKTVLRLQFPTGRVQANLVFDFLFTDLDLPGHSGDDIVKCILFELDRGGFLKYHQEMFGPDYIVFTYPE